MPSVPVKTFDQASILDNQSQEAIQDFFKQCWEQFSQASQTVGIIEHTYQFGHASVKLEFAGNALVPIFTRAIQQHGIAKPESVRLTVRIWDANSTETPMPPPPWTPSAYGPKGQITGYNSARFRTVYQPGIDLLYVMDRLERRAIIWTSASEEIPTWIRGFPLRPLFHWLSIDSPYQLLHAGAVGNGSGAVLFAGLGGSGKSTSALACLVGGMDYFGDDYLLIDTDNPPQVHNLYCSAKLHTNMLTEFKDLAESINDSPERINDKALFFLHPRWESSIKKSAPLKAILLPQVSDRSSSRIEPISPGRVFEALAPSTILQLPGNETEAFRKIKELVTKVPTYLLRAGSDIGQIPRAIIKLLEDI